MVPATRETVARTCSVGPRPLLHMREKSRTCSVGPRPLLHMREKSRTCSVGPRPLLHMREKSWTCSVGPRPLLHMREKPWTCSVGPRPLLHMREKRRTCSVGPRPLLDMRGKAADLQNRSALRFWTSAVHLTSEGSFAGISRSPPDSRRASTFISNDSNARSDSANRFAASPWSPRQDWSCRGTRARWLRRACSRRRDIPQAIARIAPARFQVRLSPVPVRPGCVRIRSRVPGA